MIIRENDLNVRLEWEKEIHWCKPEAQRMPYVRENSTLATGRSKGIRLRQAFQLVAYAILKADAPNGGIKGKFFRRYWCLHERDPYPRDNYPYGTVIPSSITTGKTSVSAHEGAIKCGQ